MKIVVQETLRYSLVSACALIVDFAVLYALVHYVSWGYVAAATASFLAGLVVAYALSVTLVFKYRRIDARSMEFTGFAGIGLVGLVINTVVISFGVKILAVHYLIAKCLAAGLTFVWNFSTRRYFLFVPRRTA